MTVTARLESTVARNRRIAPRRKLRLGSNSSRGLEVIVHNLSTTGMLVQTAADLHVSEELEVELPEVGSASATIAWRSGDYFGCQFVTAIPMSAVSAALLRSPALHPSSGEEHRLESDSAPGDSADFSTELSFGMKLRIILGTSIALWVVILWAVGVL